MPKAISYKRTLAWICVVAVALRVLAVFVLRAWEAPNAIEHAGIARNLLAGLGFSWGAFGTFGPSSIQSPTYPFLLAGLFWLFGTESATSYAVALGLNCLLAAPAAAGMASMTRWMGGREREALVAAALFCMWPTQIYGATHAQAITLITTCVIWMVALFLRFERDGRVGAWIGYSLLASLATLTEPTLLPITALSLPWMLLRARVAWPTRLRCAGILIAVVVVVMGPWTLRNRMVHGAFVPGKSGFWVNVWKGANDDATGTDRMRMPDEIRDRLATGFYSLDDARGEGSEPPHQYDALTPEQWLELEGKSEIEREKIFRRYVMTWIAAHPARFVELSVARLGMTLWIDSDNPKGHNLAYLASRAALLLLSVPGLLIAASRGWRLLFPLALFASCVGVYTLTLTAARFAFPLEPIQLALAAATIGWLSDRWRPTSRREG